MEINFFIIWFFISPFIILYLYQKNKSYKDMAGQVIDQINEVWDNQYKEILKKYGTIDNFIECHLKDFEIMRNNLVDVYESMSHINRDYMSKTEKVLELIESDNISKDEIYNAIKLIRRDICEQTDDELVKLNAFLVAEEEAHCENSDMIDILDSIGEKYKNNEIYNEINK